LLSIWWLLAAAEEVMVEAELLAAAVLEGCLQVMLALH
jgi:hypothetical protein